MLVDQYVRSLNTKNLLTFYQRACTPQLFQRLRRQALAIMNEYETIQSTASDINIQFKEAAQAEIDFSHIITGTSKDGVKQVLFEGTIKWQMTRRGETWKITQIIPTQKGKK